MSASYKEIAQIILDRGDELTTGEREALMKLLGVSSDPQSDSYSVLVDYSVSIPQLIEAGKYDTVAYDVRASLFFPLGRGIVEVEVLLLNFGKRFVSDDFVLSEMDRQGLRPANIKELLALGALFPHLQRTKRILALGSTCTDSEGATRAPYLCSDKGRRILRLTWARDERGDIWHFAAVKK